MTSIDHSPKTLENQRVAFVGKLGAMSRKDALQLIRSHGGQPLERAIGNVDVVVIGADELPAEDTTIFLNYELRRSIREGRTTLVHEHEFWQQLGMVEGSSTRQYYTPAMLAELIKTPVRNIRRWYRMGLLASARIAHRLPYFDFEQVQNAKQLAAWIARGARPIDIKRQLKDFGHLVENRSLMELDLVVDGRRILLRQGNRLLSATGQLHLDFEQLDQTCELDTPGLISIEEVKRNQELRANDTRFSRSLVDAETDPNISREEMLQAAEELEDMGEFEGAITWYRIILAKYGLASDVSFQLAELLYRCGDLSAARERYYNAVELDEDFIEARANLGCVLAETGQIQLAIAAFQGALSRDDHYPDVHYHLAKCLDETGETDASTRHWVRFLQLSPQSPWAEEALERLGRL